MKEEKDKIAIDAFQGQRSADKGVETVVRQYRYVDRRLRSVL